MGLKKRTVKLKKGREEPNYISPSKRLKGTYAQSKDYKYFEGHVIPEITDKLSRERTVVCWYSEHMLNLTICARRKFWHQQQHCKRCPLFQKDEHAQELKALITEWEIDELEENTDG